VFSSPEVELCCEADSQRRKLPDGPTASPVPPPLGLASDFPAASFHPFLSNSFLLRCRLCPSTGGKAMTDLLGQRLCQSLSFFFSPSEQFGYFPAHARFSPIKKAISHSRAAKEKGRPPYKGRGPVLQVLHRSLLISSFFFSVFPSPSFSQSGLRNRSPAGITITAFPWLRPFSSSPRNIRFS